LDCGVNIQSLSIYEWESMRVDLLGQERIRNGRIDIGAYELQIGSFPYDSPRALYVNAKDGSDDNDGLSPQSALNTVHAAFAWALDGDIIRVAPGVYSPLETYNRRLSVQGEGGARRCIIEGGGDYTCVNSLCRWGCPTNTVVRGFTIRNGRGGVFGGTFEECIITENIAEYDGGGAAYACLRNCLIYGNTAERYGGGAAYCYDMINCTVTKNKAQSGGGCHCGYTYNSIIWGNSASLHADMRLESNQDSPDANQNILGSYCRYSCTGNYVDGRGSIVGDPCFVDWANNDFRLRDDSPCINAGMNACMTRKYDVDGIRRIKGKVVDMGAYENQTAYPGAEIGYASAQQRYPWNGLVDVAFDVFGLPDNATTNIPIGCKHGHIDGGIRLALAFFNDGSYVLYQCTVDILYIHI